MPFLKSAIGTSRSFPGTFSFRARAREDRARGGIGKRDALSAKSGDSRLCATENQGVDIVSAFIRIYSLEIDEMAHDVELVGDAVSAVHIPRDSGDIERLTTIISLEK